MPSASPAPVAVAGEYVIPLRALALAVLSRALTDATAPDRGGGGAPDPKEAAEAIRFLLASDRDADLRFWCHLASVDPVRVRRAARARIGGAVASAVCPDRPAA